MSPREAKLWREAQQIARLGMGTEVVRGTHGSPRHERWKADEDPLAAWCLTEWIVGAAKRYAKAK